MNTPFTVKCLLPIPIWWNQFFPEVKSDWLEFQLKSCERDITARIGTDDISQAGVIGDIDFTTAIFPGNSLTLIFQGEWPSDLADSLEKKLHNKKVEDFQHEVKNIIKGVYEKIINLIRDHFQQYWVSNALLDDKNLWNNVMWLDSNGDWQTVFPGGIFLVSRMRKEGISKQDWTEFGKMLQNGGRPTVILTLVANAKSYLDAGNGRMAIIEVVIALEAALKQFLPKSIIDTISAQIEEKLIDKIIKELGLRLTSFVFLNHFSDRYKLDKEDCEECLNAIEIRNEIIHRNRKQVEIKAARKQVRATSKVINSLIDHNLSSKD